MAIKVGINGFGRIGRLFFRAAMRQGGIEVVGINDLVESDNLAYLLQRDTMHGRFEKQVTADAGGLTCDGVHTRCTSERDPSNLPWADLGVDYVLESTGLFTKGDDAKKHLSAGARRVLISAPTKTPDDVKTLVYKVNHEQYDAGSDTVISNASCTTNCLAPITKVILDNFGLEEGLMTTVHAATATQPTQDGPSKKDWRGGPQRLHEHHSRLDRGRQGRGSLHSRGQGQADRHVLQGSHRERLLRRPHVQDHQVDVPRGDQCRDEARFRRLDERRAWLHR